MHLKGPQDSDGGKLFFKKKAAAKKRGKGGRCKMHRNWKVNQDFSFKEEMELFRRRPQAETAGGRTELSRKKGRGKRRIM